MTRIILAIALVLFAARPALADEKAKQLYDEGLRHYNLAEYTDAITSWKEAYRLSKKPLLLFNIAQAYRLSGDCTQALTFYDSYQREEPTPKNQEELDQYVTECKAKASEAKVTPKPPDKPIEPPPPPPPPTNPPPPSPPPAPAPAPAAGGHATVGWAVGGAGIVLGLASIYFARDSSKQSNFNSGYTGPWDGPHQDAETKGQRDVKLAYVFGGLGVASLAVGVYFIVTAKSEEPHVAIAPTRGGATFVFSTSF